MSNARAIAATTATLRSLLLSLIPNRDQGLQGLDVTTQPLDVARKGITHPQLNLFLYRTILNGAWRNLDMPRQVRPGETGAPPLALNLHYLITAYGSGESDNDALNHRVLGAAMSVLHDHAVLNPSDIAHALPDNDLAQQLEHVRVTPLPMALEELSKLWTAFQTQYRISAAYEVTVAVIDSRKPVRSPLPVLKRGEGDRGVTSAAGTAPQLREIRPPRSQPAARLGEDVAILGDGLTTADTMVRFVTPRLAQPIELAPQGGGGSEIGVHLPDKAEDANALSRWAPGFYTIALVQKRSGVPPISSNELAFALAPRITVAPLTTPPGTVNLTLTCEPRIVAGQRILLLGGDRQFEPASVVTPANPTQPTTLTFTVPGVPAGTYVLRLRVDGVDSIPVIQTGTPPLPSFDPAQTVTVA